jgi:hypothetical protein
MKRIVVRTLIVVAGAVFAVAAAAPPVITGGDGCVTSATTLCGPTPTN